MASKTDVTGREKFRVKYMVGDVEVKPVRVGRSRMVWRDVETLTKEFLTWDRKEVTKIGGKK